MKELKIKRWFLDKTQHTASSYNCFISTIKAENGEDIVEDGFVTVIVEEEIAETEKAVRVKLRTGDVVGSYKGWTTWIPKSLIA